MWQRDKRIIWTGANSTSPNANQLEESYAERRTQQGNNVTKRQKDYLVFNILSCLNIYITHFLEQLLNFKQIDLLALLQLNQFPHASSVQGKLKRKLLKT